ncbi:uncharacterized protein [Coffea arabica]|uniref:Uncharacterized protein isoform X2 n=1 Tax=Coffea arabica TaxID=13443 RepID=A0ABM4UZP9_COFAR
MEGYEHEKSEWFQDCLGALDGTYVKVHVLLRDQGRYRNRKNEIATNVLGILTEMEGYEHEKSEWFQDCLEALDGTYVKVHVLRRDQGRYRNRKNEIATNVLGV